MSVNSVSWPAVFGTDANGNAVAPVGVSAPTVISGAGFKVMAGPITYWNPTYTSGFVDGLQVFIQTNSAVGSDIWRWVAPFPGSIVGFSAFQAGTGSIATVQVLKNSASLGSVFNTISSGSNGHATFTKGALPFAAGDVLQIQYEFSVAGNIFILGHMFVEMAA